MVDGCWLVVDPLPTSPGESGIAWNPVNPPECPQLSKPIPISFERQWWLRELECTSPEIELLGYRSRGIGASMGLEPLR